MHRQLLKGYIFLLTKIILPFYMLSGALALLLEQVPQLYPKPNTVPFHL